MLQALILHRRGYQEEEPVDLATATQMRQMRGKYEATPRGVEHRLKSEGETGKYWADDGSAGQCLGYFARFVVAAQAEIGDAMGKKMAEMEASGASKTKTNSEMQVLRAQMMPRMLDSSSDSFQCWVKKSEDKCEHKCVAHEAASAADCLRKHRLQESCRVEALSNLSLCRKRCINQGTTAGYRLHDRISQSGCIAQALEAASAAGCLREYNLRDGISQIDFTCVLDVGSMAEVQGDGGVCLQGEVMQDAESMMTGVVKVEGDLTLRHWTDFK